MTGSSQITANVTVAPGVTLLFGSGAQLRVFGSMATVGTPSARIRMTGEQSVRGHWNGIEINSSNTTNELAYVDLAYGGGGGLTSSANVIVTDFGRLTVRNSTFLESAGWGVFTTPFSVIIPSPLTAGGNTFTNNFRGPFNIP